MIKFLDIKKLNNYFLGLLYKNKKVYYYDIDGSIISLILPIKNFKKR